METMKELLKEIELIREYNESVKHPYLDYCQYRINDIGLDLIREAAEYFGVKLATSGSNMFFIPFVGVIDGFGLTVFSKPCKVIETYEEIG